MRTTLRSLPAIVFGVWLTSFCLAEDWSPYFGVHPQEELSLAELERQAAVRRQVQLNDAMRWRAGLPPANGVFYYPLPGNLESIYAYGPSHFFGPSVFTPWPYVPGDIWGFQHVPPSRQSIGQVQMQTGPNRWESRPVFATPLGKTPPVVAAPESGVERPPVDFIPPGRGPREY
jgi:hypothetical protein